MRRAAILTALLAAASCSSKKSGFDDTDGGPTFCSNNDCDGDGFPAGVDCNDADPMVNPAAYDFPGDGIDNDCDGKVDDPVEACETIPAAPPGSPKDFARAADVCAQPNYDPLLDARWGRVEGYGPGQRLWTSTTKPEQVNIVSSFGQNAPRRGRTMAGLSNGPWATRTPRESMPLDDPAFKLNDACAAIPLVGADCAALSNGASAGGLSVQDWAELTLTLKVPSNVRGVAFDFSFFSTEFNQFWDAALNDAFFVLVTSKENQGTNVAKDANGQAVTINSGFFQLCPKPPGPAGLSPDKSAALAHCVGLDGDPTQKIIGSLKGTFFDGAGASPYDGTASSTDGTKKYIYGGGSGWLTSSFAVAPREQLTMRIIVHDTFDGLKDSMALVDAIRWQQAADNGTYRPVR